MPSGEKSSDSETEIELSDASIGTVKRVLRETQAENNQKTVQLAERDRHIASLVNQGESSVPAEPQNHQQAQKSKTIHIENDAERSEVKEFARTFTYMYALWVRPTDKNIFVLEPNPCYDPRKRFSSIEEEKQGLLFDLLNLVPNDWHTRIRERLFIKQFLLEMKQQKSNACSRLHAAGPLILDCTNEVFNNQQCRSSTFKTLIGFSSHDGKDTYTPLAPILYKDDPNQTDEKWTIFRHPILMKTYSALLRGPGSIKCLSEGQVTRVDTHSNLETKWEIRHVTPGAIAMAAILARFVASADKSLLPCGAVTKINYQSDYETYFKYLHTGLHEKKVSVVDIFKTWNEIFYPDTENPSNNSNSGVTKDVTTLFDELRADEVVEEPDQSEPEDNPPTQTEPRNSTPAYPNEEDSVTAPRMTLFPNQPSPLTDIENASRDRRQNRLSSPLIDVSNSGRHIRRNTDITPVQSSKNQISGKRKVIQSDDSEDENIAPPPVKPQRSVNTKRRKVISNEAVGENVSPQVIQKVRRSGRSKKH